MALIEGSAEEIEVTKAEIPNLFWFEAPLSSIKYIWRHPCMVFRYKDQGLATILRHPWHLITTPRFGITDQKSTNHCYLVFPSFILTRASSITTVK